MRSSSGLLGVLYLISALVACGNEGSDTGSSAAGGGAGDVDGATSSGGAISGSGGALASGGAPATGGAQATGGTLGSGGAGAEGGPPPGVLAEIRCGDAVHTATCPTWSGTSTGLPEQAMVSYNEPTNTWRVTCAGIVPEVTGDLTINLREPTVGTFDPMVDVTRSGDYVRSFCDGGIAGIGYSYDPGTITIVEVVPAERLVVTWEGETMSGSLDVTYP